MKMLVASLSLGKFKNEAELFSLPVSDDNVILMGQMIALQVFRNVLVFDYKVVEKLYNGLIKDLHHSNDLITSFPTAMITVRLLFAFFFNSKADTFTKPTLTTKKASLSPLKQLAFVTSIPIL